MLLIILRYIFGYVRAEVSGFAPERFMNLIIKNEIVIWDVEHTECGYAFFTGRKNLMKMKPFLQKTNMKIHIIKKIGLPYFIKRNRKRCFFLFGCIGAFALLYILSLFVWEVRVTGETELVADELLKTIDEKYVPLGTLKKEINCSELEEKLREEYDEISWVSCELKGTRLTIYLEEGMAPKVTNEKAESRDIVASEDAVITKMITRQGTPMVKVKDKVKKGDILISGTIYIYDDNNEVLETSYIAADGDIYGTTKMEYEDYVDLKYYQKKYEKNSKKYYTFYVMDYCLTPYTPKMDTKDYDTYTEIRKLRILKDFYLPVGYKKHIMTNYKLVQKEYSKEAATKLLQNRINKKINTFKEKGVEIVENNVKIEQKDNRMIAKGDLVLTKSIVSFKKTSEIPVSEKEEE